MVPLGWIGEVGNSAGPAIKKWLSLGQGWCIFWWSASQCMSDVVPVLGPPINSRLGDGWNLCTQLPPILRRQGWLSRARYDMGFHSSSETPVSRKCATTTGAVDSEGLIVVKESIAMKRRGAPWRLPKFEYIFSLASASFSATMSRVYGCSFFRDLNDPVALKAFMTLATSGHDLTSTARKLLVVRR